MHHPTWRIPVPEDPTRSTLIRTMERMGFAQKTGIPWGMIAAVIGTVAGTLTLMVTLKTQGWFPVLRITFDRHVIEEYVPLNADVICEKCKSECRTIMCPACTELQCLNRCRATGDCT